MPASHRLLLLIPLALSVPTRAVAEPTARFGDVQPAKKKPAAPKPAAPKPAAQKPAPVRHAGAPLPGDDVAPPSHSWARNSIAELMRRARDDERHGEAARAMTAYTRAIQLDPTYGPAMLRLGRLREAAGDVREAERLYTAAARLREYAAEALEHRAKLLLHNGQKAEAFRDLRAAVARDDQNTALRRELASWYAKRRMWPAALAEWRRLAALLEAKSGSPGLRQARLQVKALAVLAGSCDPVRAGASNTSWVRRALASMAR